MILDKSDNLPSDIVDFFDFYNARNSVFLTHLNNILKSLDQFEMYVRATYNYKTLILGLLKKDDFRQRVFSPNDCSRLAANMRARISFFPKFYPEWVCSPFWKKTMRRIIVPISIWLFWPDGSRTAQEVFFFDSVRRTGSQLVLDKRIDDNSRSELQYGDEKIIAKIMRDINRIVTEKGRKVVFVIPPIYKEGGNLPGEILSRTFEMVPDLNIVDHRHIEKYRTYFIDHEHPSNKYFSYLIRVLQSEN